MSPVVRYGLLTGRLFVRQWSIRNVLFGAVGLLPLIFLGYNVIGFPRGMPIIAPLVLSWIAGVGYACGLALRGRAVTPDHAQGGVGFSLPISARARWISGVIASAVLGLILLGTLMAIGLTWFGTWSLDSFSGPVGIAMIAYLPWAGFAFLGREGAPTKVFLGVLCVGLLQLAVLDQIELDVPALSLWYGLLLVGSFLVAPRLEYARTSRGRGSVRKALVGVGATWQPRLPALGAPPRSPVRAWTRVLVRPLAQSAIPLALIAVLMNTAGAYWTTDAGDSIQVQVLGSFYVIFMMAFFASVGIPLAVRGAAFTSLTPATLLPLPSRSLWWGTLLGAVPVALLIIAASMASAVAAALLIQEPIDPTQYRNFLATAPALVAFVLLLRASWQLGFLLTRLRRALSIVGAFVAYVGCAASSIWHPSWVVSWVALAVTVGFLALLAPQRYRAPA
jgi:hypothetical protein